MSRTLFLRCFSSFPEKRKSHYEVLEISSNATKQEIHSAFLRLAKKYHPDSSEVENAGDQFYKIQQAYMVLSDVDKKRNYDWSVMGRWSHNPHFSASNAERKAKRRRVDAEVTDSEPVSDHQKTVKTRLETITATLCTWLYEYGHK